MKFPIDPYSLDEFFIKPTDEKGHGKKVSARITPDLGRLVEVLVSSRKFPYRTSSDLFRDAIWRLCGLLTPMADDHQASDLMTRLNMMEDLNEELLRYEKASQVINDLGLRLLAIKSLEHRKEMVKMQYKLAEGIKNDYWRETIVGMIKERYGEYLE